MSDLESYTFLIWFLIGIGFAVAELMVPGLILIFFALGAWVTAIICMFSDISLAAQLALFTAASLVSLFLLRRYMKNAFQGIAEASEAEEIEQSDIGKTAIVTQTIKPSLAGEIKYRGSFWKAYANEKIAVDVPVKILAHMEDDSQALKVEAIK